MNWENHYWGMHMFWWIVWLAAVFGLGFWSWPTQAKRRNRALEALRRTYAAGEIAEDEYRRRLAVLAESKPPGEQGRSAA